MQKLLLHVGAHKTASTYLQHNLIANREALAAMNWRFVHVYEEFPDARRRLIRLQKGEELEASEREPLDAFFKEMRDEPKNVFLSSEDFLGAMNMMESGGVIYPCKGPMIALLKEQFSAKQITVAFCMRDFGDFIESSYNWLVRLGASYRFDKYVKEIDFQRMSWLSVVQELSDAFGATNLLLWTYEDFQLNAVESVRAILKAASIDSVDLSVPLVSKKNPSYPPDALDILRNWNKLLRSRKSLKKDKITTLRTQMRQLLGKAPRRGGSPHMLPADIREQLSARYKTELSSIWRDWPNAMLQLPTASSTEN